LVSFRGFFEGYIFCITFFGWVVGFFGYVHDEEREKIASMQGFGMG
jgi:hypothetical protein